MKKKSTKAKKSSIIPLFVFALVLGGFSVVMSQVSQQQNVQTRAQTMPSPPNQNNFNPNAPPTNCPNTAAELQNSANETAMFNAINAYRQQNGRNVIMNNSAQLKKSAKWYSKDLSTNNVQMPNGIDSFNRPLENRLFDCVVDLAGEFKELIGIGANANDVLVALQADPMINGDLLSSTADYMAVGQTGNYWVIDMASPPGSGPNQPVTNAQAQQQQQQQQQQNQNQGTNIPSPACLGSCPTGGADTGGAAGGTANQAGQQTGEQPTPCPSTDISTNNVGNDIEANHRRKKHKNKTKDDAILQQLIKLIEELIRLLGGTVPETTTPTDGTDAGTDAGTGGTGGATINPC